LCLGKGLELVVWLDVVPGIELEDIVALFEEARSELKGVAALHVVAGIVGATGVNLGRLDALEDLPYFASFRFGGHCAWDLYEDWVEKNVMGIIAGRTKKNYRLRCDWRGA
jgi:NAD(P)-dependent dehydrogenase (short-subunit alcohol dehydrogenase family)